MHINPDSANIFAGAIDEHIAVVTQMRDQLSTLEAIARDMAAVLRSGGKILWCGNGGSAADAQHMAAEFVGRFRCERAGMASISLTTDTSILTAIGNDYGYEKIFSRQVEALGMPGDLIVGISTSGNSPNVAAALDTARAAGLKAVAFTGAGGGKLGEVAHHLFAVQSRDTARIQESHILAGHIICDWVEQDCVWNTRNAMSRETADAR